MITQPDRPSPLFGLVLVLSVLCLCACGMNGRLSNTGMATVTSVTEALVATDAYSASGLNTISIAQNQIATYKGNQYIAYVNVTLQITIIKRTLATGLLTAYTPALPAIAASYSGVADDEHKIAALSIDKNGYLHLSYGMHNAPLIYYKSANPEDPGSWSAALPMLGTNETSVTYPMFVKHPRTGELYFTFRAGIAGNGDQYFYHYNASTIAWEAAVGTGPEGIVINGMATPTSAYLNGLPKWNAAATRLYWNWQWNPGVDQYLMYWDGATFVKFGDAPQPVPASAANLMPIINASSLTDQNDFNVDPHGVVLISYSGLDRNGIRQVYLAESSTGSFLVHQLTQNTAASPLAVYPTVLPLDGSVYVVYPDVFNPRGGTVAYRSTDSFASWSKSYPGLPYSPNWALNCDPTEFPQKLSFLFMQADDLVYGIVDPSVKTGELSLISWVPSP